MNFATNDKPASASFYIYNPDMPLAMIIIIGWLYVTVLIAANEPSILAGVLSFAFYGALPCGLIIYFAGGRVRRERRKYKEMMAEKTRRDTGC